MKTSKYLYQYDVNQSFTDIHGTYVDCIINNVVYRIAAVNGSCLIPDELLQIKGSHKVYECFDDGTITEFTFTVTERPMPPDYVYTPTQRLTFDGLVKKVNDAVAELYGMAEDGIFDGDDGVSPEVSVSVITGGHKVTITDVEGEHSFNVLNGTNGAKGDKGDKGDQGEKGDDGDAYTITDADYSAIAAMTAPMVTGFVKTVNNIEPDANGNVNVQGGGGSSDVTKAYVDQQDQHIIDMIPDVSGKADKSEIPVVPSNVSAFTNDAEYITSSDIPSIPTKTSELTNDSDFTTTGEVADQLDLKQNKLTAGDNITITNNIISAGEISGSEGIAYDIIEGAYINVNNGLQTSYSAYNCTDFIEMSFGLIVKTVVNGDSGAVIAFYDKDKNFIKGSSTNSTAYNTRETEFYAPYNAKYARVTCRATWISNLVIKNITITEKFGILSDTRDLCKDISDFATVDLFKNYTRSSGSMNGVSFTWNNDVCTVSGTSTGYSFTNLYYSTSSLPENIIAGDTVAFSFETTDENIKLGLYCYDESGNVTKNVALTETSFLTIPNNTHHMYIRVEVRNVTVNGIFKMNYFGNAYSTLDLTKLATTTNIKAPTKKLLISFIDDDVTNNGLVTKYHDNCLHNGIVGNYAVITKQLEQNLTDKDLLLGYADEGFGMLMHCYSQQLNDYWTDVSGHMTECRTDLMKALRQMREYGFINYNHWVIPNGITTTDKENQFKLAREVGVESAIAIGSRDWNKLTSDNPYWLKRLSFQPTDASTESRGDMTSLKGFLLSASQEDCVWVLVSTHFNEWSSLVWDSTLDDIGHPIGYARFNELVQYALGLGYECVNFNEAWSYWKNVFNYNQQNKL